MTKTAFGGFRACFVVASALSFASPGAAKPSGPQTPSIQNFSGPEGNGEPLDRQLARAVEERQDCRARSLLMDMETLARKERLKRSDGLEEALLAAQGADLCCMDCCCGSSDVAEAAEGVMILLKIPVPEGDVAEPEIQE